MSATAMSYWADVGIGLVGHREQHTATVGESLRPDVTRLALGRVKHGERLHLAARLRHADKSTTRPRSREVDVAIGTPGEPLSSNAALHDRQR